MVFILFFAFIVSELLEQTMLHLLLLFCKYILSLTVNVFPFDASNNLVWVYQKTSIASYTIFTLQFSRAIRHLEIVCIIYDLFCYP